MCQLFVQSLFPLNISIFEGYFLAECLISTREFLVMKKILLFLFLGTIVMDFLKASKSEIILINAEAFLVDIENDYDVVKVHKKIPNYFTDPATHEELLAYHKSTIGSYEDIGHLSEVEDDWPEKAYASVESISCSKLSSFHLTSCTEYAQAGGDQFCLSTLEQQSVQGGTGVVTVSTPPLFTSQVIGNEAFTWNFLNFKIIFSALPNLHAVELRVIG